MHSEEPAPPARPDDDEQPLLESTEPDDEPVEAATPRESDSGPEPGDWVGV